SLLDYTSNYSKKNILGILKKYTLGLPSVIISAIKGKTKELEVSSELKSKLIYLTQDQYSLIKSMDNIVSLDADAKQGILTMTVSLPEALAAAQLAQKAQDILQRDIIDFKVQKAKADLDFIQGRYDVAKAEAEGYQMNLARKTDQYKNLTSAVPQVQSDRLQSRYGIANSVFQDLAKQLEQAKIQVKKDTPVFTIVQPVTIPSEKSKPSRALIMIIWIFMGGLVGAGIVFGKGYMEDVKKKWQEEE
ncbi:MAG: GNVR domain-containing protein, partial [Paludibacter sp.]